MVMRRRRAVTVRSLACTIPLLDAAIHRIPMNEQGRTRDGNFIRDALQRASERASEYISSPRRTKDEGRGKNYDDEKVQRRVKRKRKAVCKRCGLRRRAV